jgi:hypothetical protein
MRNSLTRFSFSVTSNLSESCTANQRFYVSFLYAMAVYTGPTSWGGFEPTSNLYSTSICQEEPIAASAEFKLLAGGANNYADPLVSNRLLIVAFTNPVLDVIFPLKYRI